jgi:5-formyltetrahydrofolate cyclo-ligase
MAKAELRHVMMARRDALPVATREAARHELVSEPCLSALRHYLPSSGAVVAGYHAIRSELDPDLLIERLGLDGYQIALPRVGASGLNFHRNQPGNALLRGRFGLAEPSPDAPEVEPALFLVPLLAFDRAMNRLGYGKAYYDRAFVRWPLALRIGLAYRCQEVPRVPVETHDLPLQHVLAVGP